MSITVTIWLASLKVTHSSTKGTRSQLKCTRLLHTIWTQFITGSARFLTNWVHCIIPLLVELCHTFIGLVVNPWHWRCATRHGRYLNIFPHSLQVRCSAPHRLSAVFTHFAQVRHAKPDLYKENKCLFWCLALAETLKNFWSHSQQLNFLQVTRTRKHCVERPLATEEWQKW